MVFVFSVLLLHSYSAIKSSKILPDGAGTSGRERKNYWRYGSVILFTSPSFSLPPFFLSHVSPPSLCYLSHSSYHLKDSLMIGSLRLSKVLNNRSGHSLSMLHDRHERHNPSQPGNVLQGKWFKIPAKR
jgi:hypothetical protein